MYLQCEIDDIHQPCECILNIFYNKFCDERQREGERELYGDDVSCISMMNK